MEELKYILKSASALKNMIVEMNSKNIELKRITKTAALLLLSGISPNSIPQVVVKRCLNEQNPDGGWVSIVDTMWNVFFLKEIDENKYLPNIAMGLDFLRSQRNTEGLWGRSNRDISRIPVTGILLYLLPELADQENLLLLERLWQLEKNSITYKAAYTLMAFKRNDYNPEDKCLLNDTIQWLINNQKEDGGYSPWRDHPVDSDVYCTSLASIGLLQYRDMLDDRIFRATYEWLILNQLKSGIWRFHEIEDGASWGLFALVEIMKSGVLNG